MLLRAGVCTLLLVIAFLSAAQSQPFALPRLQASELESAGTVHIDSPIRRSGETFALRIQATLVRPAYMIAELIDTSGRQVFVQQAQLKAGQSQWECPIKGVSPGMYLLRVYLPGETKTQKLLLQ
ncbi:MAG: hypothetical protein OHK0039_07450 [Bacteroidia bacterium]